MPAPSVLKPLSGFWDFRQGALSLNIQIFLTICFQMTCFSSECCGALVSVGCGEYEPVP